MLSTTQLAHRLGVQQSTVVRLEQSEKRGAVTLNSLRKAAEALGCELVYAFVPNKSVSGKARQRSQTPRRQKPRRRTSQFADQLATSEIKLARKLSAAQRMRRAFQLSDFARKLRQCSN